MSAIKHRVLCLHGYRQTGAKLHVRISGFRRAFKSSVEFGMRLLVVHAISVRCCVL